MLQRLSNLKRNPRFTGIRKYLNLLYYDPNGVCLKISNFDYIVVDGCKFYVNDQIDSVQRLKDNPWFANIRKGDIALDLGANIGAITIPLAKAAKKVYAVEPLFYRELNANIELNGLENVQVWDVALGKDYSLKKFTFSSRSDYSVVIPFKQIRRDIGRIDWMKVDIEGYEWLIKPEECEGIRELRFEFHIRRKHKRSDRRQIEVWKEWLRKNKYRVWTQLATPPLCAPFTDCYLLSASKI